MCIFSSLAEVNYYIGNRELLAIKVALEEWRHWLEGKTHPFVVLTNHKNIQYLRDTQCFNPRQAPIIQVTRMPEQTHSRHLYGTVETTMDTEPIIPTHLIVSPIEWESPPATTQNPPAAQMGCLPEL